ncbi:MAG: FkbM family methyltransferase [Acidobacteriota bacterium]
MGANSFVRKLTKVVLFPLANERVYRYVQAASKAYDIRSRAWWEPEIELVELGLLEGETGLDVGANFGIYAYYMSRAAGRTGKVYSFEPVQFTFETLKIVGRLLRFTHNVELVNQGCSNENATLSFAVPVQQSGAFAAGQAYLGNRNDEHSGKESQVRWESTTNVEAKVIRLDDFLPDASDISMIKIDIEGAELLCLQGAEELIDRNLPTIICEINPWFLEGFGLQTQDLTDFVERKGYRIFAYRKERGTPALVQMSTAEIVEDNYVFIHPSRESRFKELIKA